MEKYLIFVEGIADVYFLRDFIMFHISELKYELEKRKKKVVAYNIKGESLLIKIIIGGGYTAVKNAKVRFETHKTEAYQILVIQDADNPQKQEGGVRNRMLYLDAVKRDLEIDFETFLFPDNENDGDLETLLLKIIDKNKFEKSFECYKKYVDCSTKLAQENYSEELLKDKNIVFNYFRTYYGMNGAREENRKYETPFWDLASPELEPLKLFFVKNILQKRTV